MVLLLGIEISYFMMHVEEGQARKFSSNSDDSDDSTAPFYETEVFYSIWDALKWKHVRARVPVCFKKTIRSRYMLANLIYLGYTIGNLITDFNFSVNASTGTTSTNDTGNITETTTVVLPILDQPAGDEPIVNSLYFGFNIVHLISAFAYWWAWHDRSWRDIIMIPEYLNHIEAGLYIWSSSWYPKLDTLGGYYALSIHKIEMTAALVDLVANFGWIMSWYMTYTRTLGRGFTLDDPDVIAFSATTTGSMIYVVYSIQVHVYPEEYNDNTLYTYGDIIYCIGACYYVFANLRDHNWFWFLSFAGQYGVAAGRIHVDTKVLPQYGRPVVLMTDCCPQRRKKQIEKAKSQDSKLDIEIITSYH